MYVCVDVTACKRKATTVYVYWMRLCMCVCATTFNHVLATPEYA